MNKSNLLAILDYCRTIHHYGAKSDVTKKEEQNLIKSLFPEPEPDPAVDTSETDGEGYAKLVKDHSDRLAKIDAGPRIPLHNGPVKIDYDTLHTCTLNLCAALDSAEELRRREKWMWDAARANNIRITRINRNLYRSVEDYHKARKDLITEVDTLRAENRTLIQQVSTLQADNKALESVPHILRGTIDMLDKQVQNLVQDRDASQATNKILDGANASLKGTIGTLHQTINTLRAENAKFNGTVAGMRMNEYYKPDVISTLNHTNSVLTQENVRAFRMVGELENQLNDIRPKHEQLKGTIEMLNRQNTHGLATIHKLEEDINTIRSAATGVLNVWPFMNVTSAGSAVPEFTLAIARLRREMADL
jgi:archaellum component FlaC